MLRRLQASYLAFLSFIASAALCGQPGKNVGDLPDPRAIAAYDSLARGYQHVAAFSPDGRRVAVLVTLPPASLGPPPYPLTLQIWDSVTLKLLASRDLGFMSGPVGTESPDIHYLAPYQCFLSYAADGSFLVVSEVNARARSGDHISSLYDVKARLRFVAAADLQDLRSINLDLSRDDRAYGPSQVQLSPAGDRVAVALSPLDPFIGSGFGAACRDFQGTEVRAYDVGTGHALWMASFNDARSGGLAWSPDGLKLALTLQLGLEGDKWFRASCPERDMDNLLILESTSGRVLVTTKTNDLAGPVCFGPHDEVFTAPFHFYYTGSKGEQAKVWNAQTGVLKRSIGLRDRDVHNLLGLSRDGTVLIGYVGKEKLGFSWRAMEDVQENIDQRFAAWDAVTGGLIAISPDLKPLFGPWRGQESKLRLHLAPSGKSLLATCDTAPAKMLLFDLPDTRILHSGGTGDR